MREDFEEDDYEGEDDLSPEEQDAYDFNDLLMKEITYSLAPLSNRELLDCLCYIMDKLDFTGTSELVLVGIEFNQQYMLQFYNVREDKTFKTPTGAGNIYSLLDGWVRKTLSDTYFYRLYGDLGETSEEASVDVWMNFMLDVQEWKMKVGLELPLGHHDDPEDPEALAPA